MRFALPISSSGMLSPHFGHSEQFVLIDVDAEKKEIINREVIESPEHTCGSLVYLLAERDVSTVIAGGMGANPRMLFQQNGIGVVLGALESDPDKAVLSYLDGVLATGDNACDSTGTCHHSES